MGMKLAVVILVIVSILGFAPKAAQQTPPAPWQYETEEPPTREPWQYDPAPTVTPPPRWEYEPQPTSTPYTSTATPFAWMNPTTGDNYFGSEISTGPSIESSALANDLDVERLRQSGSAIHREVYTIPGSSAGWRSRAGVNAMYSASIEGNDGYIVKLSNGPRVCIVAVANFHGNELDVEKVTQYIEGVARFGVRHRPSVEFVQTPYDALAIAAALVHTREAALRLRRLADTRNADERMRLEEAHAKLDTFLAKLGLRDLRVLVQIAEILADHSEPSNT